MKRSTQEIKTAAWVLAVGDGWIDADNYPTDKEPVLLANVDLQATRLTVDTCVFRDGKYIDWRGIPIGEETKRLPVYYKKWNS